MSPFARPSLSTRTRGRVTIALASQRAFPLRYSTLINVRRKTVVEEALSSFHSGENLLAVDRENCKLERRGSRKIGSTGCHEAILIHRRYSSPVNVASGHFALGLARIRRTRVISPDSRACSSIGIIPRFTRGLANADKKRKTEGET